MDNRKNLWIYSFQRPSWLDLRSEVTDEGDNNMPVPVPNPKLLQMLHTHACDIAANGFSWSQDGPKLFTVCDLIMDTTPDVAGDSDIRIYLCKFLRMMSVAYNLRMSFPMIDAFVGLYVTHRRPEM